MHGQDWRDRVLHGRRVRATARAGSWIRSSERELWRGLPPDAETFLARACPIVASYGAKDRWTRGVAQQLEQMLTAADIAHDVKEYPEAGHSFLNNPGTWWFNALRVIHIGYHEPSAEDARRRIVSFFQQHLSS